MTTGNEANSIRLSSVQVPGNCEIDKLLAGFDYEKERDGDYSTLNEGSIFLNDRLIASGSEDTSDLQYTRMRKQTFYPSLALLLKITLLSAFLLVRELHAREIFICKRSYYHCPLLSRRTIDFLFCVPKREG